VLELTDRAELRSFLERHALWARKALSQNYLCSPTVVKAILGRLEGFTGALEIGPGPGVLTAALANTCKRVIALEVDERMIPALAESAPSAEVRLCDALKVNLGAILDELPAPKALVSNMPYQITGPLLTLAAEHRRRYQKAVLMMQREVAQRVLAQPGDSARGSLSVYLQTQFHISKVAAVPPGAFLPPPKVSSSVLEFVPKESGLRSDEEAGFFKLVRHAFRQPRKTLANNVVGLFTREQVESWLVERELPRGTRPHMLTMDQWMDLWSSLKDCHDP